MANFYCRLLSSVFKATTANFNRAPISQGLIRQFITSSSFLSSSFPVTAQSSRSSISTDLSQNDEVVQRINAELTSNGAAGRLFAVIHAAGKQRKVTVEDIIILDKPIDADIGDRIRLNKVLLVGGRDFTVIGRPVLSASQALVEATVIEKTLSHSKICFWYHRRQNHRVFRVHKDQLVFLRINRIDLAPLAKDNESASR